MNAIAPAPDTVSHDLLARLATPHPTRGYDAATEAQIAEALPALAAELIARRRQGPAIPSGALCLAFATDAAEARAAEARAKLRGAVPLSARELTAAATTVLIHTRNPADAFFARQVLAAQTATEGAV